MGTSATRDNVSFPSQRLRTFSAVSWEQAVPTKTGQISKSTSCDSQCSEKAHRNSSICCLCWRNCGSVISPFSAASFRIHSVKGRIGLPPAAKLSLAAFPPSGQKAKRAFLIASAPGIGITPVFGTIWTILEFQCLLPSRRSEREKRFTSPAFL